MIGEAGYFTGLPAKALADMIDVVKGVEPETGYGAILAVSETEAKKAGIKDKKINEDIAILAP